MDLYTENTRNIKMINTQFLQFNFVDYDDFKNPINTSEHL